MRSAFFAAAMMMLVGGVSCEKKEQDRTERDFDNDLCMKSAYDRPSKKHRVRRQGFLSNFGAPDQSWFTDAEREEIERKLQEFSRDLRTEFVIVEIPAIGKQVAWSELFYIKKHWNVGRGFKNGGAIMVVATTGETIAWNTTLSSSVSDADMHDMTVAMREGFDGGFVEKFMAELDILFAKTRRQRSDHDAPHRAPVTYSGKREMTTFSENQTSWIFHLLNEFSRDAGAEVVIVEVTPSSTKTAASELDYARKYLHVGTGYCNGGAIIVISPSKKEVLWSVTPKFGAQDADMKAFADAVTGHFDGGDFNKAFISELKLLLEKAKQPAPQCPGHQGE